MQAWVDNWLRYRTTYGVLSGLWNKYVGDEARVRVFPRSRLPPRLPSGPADHAVRLGPPDACETLPPRDQLWGLARAYWAGQSSSTPSVLAASRAQCGSRNIARPRKIASAAPSARILSAC